MFLRCNESDTGFFSGFLHVHVRLVLRDWMLVDFFLSLPDTLNPHSVPLVRLIFFMPTWSGFNPRLFFLLL